MSVQDYGWAAVAPESCGYIAPSVLDIVQRRGFTRVLDLGCGNGQLCGELTKIVPVVAGIEYDRHGYELASQAVPRVQFFNLGVQDDPAPVLAAFPGGFDAVVSTEVIEHLYLPAQLPAFAKAVLAERGYLIISTPYHGYLKNLLLSIFNKWDFHHTALWDGGHIKFWSRKTLTQLLHNAGFDVLEFRGVGRLPYLWKSMILVARLKKTS